MAVLANSSSYYAVRSWCTHSRAIGSKNVVVRLIHYNNERTTGVSVESCKIHLQTVQELH